MAKKDTANKPEVSDDIITRVGQDKLSDLKSDSEDFLDELKHNFGVNIYDALTEVGWIDAIAKTQIDGLDPKAFFEAIEYKLIDSPQEELETFRDALEDNLSEQVENIPYLEDIKTALEQDDPEAYIKDQVTTKVGELETGAKNKAIDFVIDSLDLPINLTRTARGVLFDKDIYSGDKLTINYSGGKPFDGDYSQDVNYRYTNEDGKWGDLNLTSKGTSTYEYNKGPIDLSLSRRPGGDTRGEFKYSQDFDFGNKGKFGIEASINDLLQTNIALGYKYVSPRTGAWFQASYNPNNPNQQQELKFDTPILTPNGYIDSQMINNSFNLEFGIPLGAERRNNRSRSQSSYSPRSDVEQTIFRPSTAYKGPSINPETGLQEFNLKSSERIKEIEKEYGVKIKPFPDELIKFLPRNTRADFFGAYIGRDGKLVFLDDITNSKNPRIERINGQIYLPEDEVDVLTKIANSRKEEIKIVKEGTRNIPDARGFHSGLDDQSKFIDQEIIDAGRMGSAAAIEYAKDRGRNVYGQRMSVLPERGKGEIYRIRGLDTEAGEEPLPLSYKYRTEPKPGDQYTPFRKSSIMKDGSVSAHAVYNPQTDTIVYDDDEITKYDNPYPNTFRTYKDYVDHHELYHRGPGPGGAGGFKDHETMDKYFDELEKSNVSTGLQKLTGIANQPPQDDVEMQKDIEKIEDKGRKGDTALVHVTPGEMIVTPEMVNDDPEFKAVLEKKYAEYGIDPGQATVGDQKASTNSSTGLEEFNLLSPGEGSMARSPTTRRNSMKVDATSGTLTRPMVYQPESIDTMGEAFRAGINSGWNNIKAQNKNTMAAINALLGDEVAERNYLREGNILEEQSGLALAGLDSTFSSAIEEGNIHDFFLNTASAVGQFIPSLAASLAEAIAVGGVVVGGTVLSRGTATPALLSGVGALSTARRAATATKTARIMQRTRPGMDKMDVEDLLERAYRNQVQVQKGKAPNFPFTPQELQDLDEIYGALRSLKRSRRFTQGAVLGAYSQEQRMGTGIAYSDYADQGMGGTDGAIKSILQGQAFGAIGVGSEIAVAGITLKRLRQARTAKKSKTSDPFKFEAVPPHSMFKDFATIAAVTGTSEALAESLQEELSIQQKLRIDDDYTKEQASVDRVNAFFAGLMGGLGVGGGLGSGTAVMNKVRNYHARNIADREMFRILSNRENLAKIGRVMAERPKAIRGQFADMKNPNSAIDSVFVDIDSKKAWIKEQGRIEKMFGADELISVATPTGAFFTTNPRKATRLANIMDSGYKFHTGILEDFLADALGYSRSRDPGDDVVVGLYNEKLQEFTKYQSAQENVEGDVEAAKAAMNKLRMALDPKQYTIKVQTLAQHRRFRQKGVDKGTTPASARKELYQTDETMSEMNTDQDDRGVEGDRGRVDPNVTAANIDIRKGKIDRQTREAFDAYIQEDYKLPINYSDLVFFVENSKKLVRAKDKKQIRKTLGKNRQRYLEIYKDLTNAESMGRGDVFTQEDREYLQRISTDFTSLVSSMEDLLEELAVTGQALQQEDSIGSSIARDEFGSREVMNLPLVGVSEVLTRTNITGEKQDQKTAKAPIKENDPTVMKRGGSGTAQNPFIDPTKIKGKGGIGTKGFRISKEDPKAHGNSVNGINNLIHATLKEEFNAQKPFLTKGAIEMFKRRAAETEQNTQFEFLRFVDTRDLKALRTATAANEPFVAPQRDPKKDAKRSYVIVRMKPEAEQFREVTRENVDIFRNVKEDLATRFEQAYQRTRGKNYKDDIYFYIQNLDPAAKSKVARPVDMSVLIEGVSRLSKILGRREQEEFTNPQAQRLSAFIDTIDLLTENNYSIEYEPYAQAKKESKPEDRFTIDDAEYRPLQRGEVRPRKPEVGPPSPIVKVNKVLDAIATDPFGAGESILKIRIPKYELAMDPAAEQIKYLRRQFGLVKLAKDYYTRDLFAEVNTPFVQLLDRLGQNNPTIDTSTVLPLLKNVKQTNMAEMSLEQLEDLQDNIEDVLTVTYGIIDTGAFTNYAISQDPNLKITPGLMLALKKKGIENRSETAKQAFGRLVRQDGTLVALLTEISKVVSAINAQDIRNNPGVLVDSSKPLGQPGAEVIPGSKRLVGERAAPDRTQYDKFMGPKYVGRGYYQAFINDLKKEGKSNAEIKNISSQIREVHVYDLQTDYPQLGIEGIEKDGSTLSLTPEGENRLKSLEPTATRLMVGNHGVYIEMNEPADVGKFVKKRLQYNEYTRDGVKLYDQFKTVNYANYKPGKWYADPKEYSDLKKLPLPSGIESTTTTQQTRTELEDLTGFEQVGRLETETIPGRRVGRPSKQPKDGVGPAQPDFVQEPGQEFTQLVTEQETTQVQPREIAFDYKGTGNIPATYKPDRITGSLDKSPAGTINRDAPIGTYVDDIAQITMERATAPLDDTGLYMTDDPAMGAPVDNSAIKMDIRDRNLFESYQEQQGKEYRGRDKYADMSRVTKKGTKPKLKDFNKYDKKTQLFLTRDKRIIKEVEDNFKEALKERAKKMGAGTSVTRAKLPFRKQIINNLIAGARQLGLETNLKIIAAETSFADSQLSPDVKETINQEQFEKSRQDLLDKTDKAAKTISYEDFDVILMKTSDVMSEGQYYSAFLKELGNSLTFQELERSIKVPAVRKKLLQDFEKKLEGENVPESYKGDDGFENFLADQWSIEIRKTLGLDVDGTAYDSMSGPTKAWFKRLTNSQKKLYNKLNPAQRKRLQIDETFEEYAADLRDAVANPEAQKLHYKTKAKIESQIENILGPETATDKELRKLMRQAQSILRSRKLPRWMQKVFLSSDTRMRNYTSHPTAGEELANFWNQDPRTVSKSGISGVYTRKNRRANALHNTAAKKLGVVNGWLYSKLTADQKKSVDLAADDTKDANVLTPEAQAVRTFLQEDVYKKLNLERFGVPNRKNFFPRDVLVAEIAGNEALQEKTREVLQKYNPKATKKQIDKDVAYLIKSGDGGLEITADSEIEVGLLKDRKKLWSNVPNKALMDAGLAAPAEVALQKYLANVAMKYEFEQSGGKKALDRILNKLNEAEREDAKKVIASMNGKTPPIENGLLKVFNNVMLPLNVITLLAFTVLASLQDTAGPILRSRGTAKISDVSKVIKDMMKNPTQAADFAREIGVIGVDAMSSFFIYAGEQNFMNQTAKDVSDVWFRITGLEAYTKFTRVFAVGMGTRFLQDHARKAKDGDKTSQLYLKELNVTADQVLAWEKGKANKATREVVNNALAQFVDESIVRPNPAQRPTYANDPRWATIWQLKSFFYAYGKTIVFPTLKEAHRGFVNQGMGAGAMPLLLMAGILIPITMLGLEIREATKAMLAWLLPGIDPNDPGVNYFKSDKMSTGEYMTEIIDRSGMLGPLSLALPIFSADHRYGKPFWVPPLGPTAERIYDARPWDFEMRTVDFIPVYSQLDTRALGR